MKLTDGITINGMHSFDDFDLLISAREIGLPEKKIIQETIPYMNGFYDFSALNGTPAWDSREISYTFDVVGVDVEEMEENKRRVTNWIMNCQDANIFDDSIADYHFKGSYDSCSWSENGEQGELTVTFRCYPFQIANAETVHNIGVGTYEIVNNGQSVAPVARSTAGATIRIGNYQTTIPANVNVELPISVEHGANTVVVSGGSVLLKWYDEIF